MERWTRGANNRSRFYARTFLRRWERIFALEHRVPIIKERASITLRRYNAERTSPLLKAIFPWFLSLLHGPVIANKTHPVSVFPTRRISYSAVLFERLTRMEPFRGRCIVRNIFNRSIYNSLFIAFRLIRIAPERLRVVFHPNNNH